MSASKHYIGEKGTILSIDTGITLTGIQQAIISIKKPDGTIENKDAIVSGTKLQYIFTYGDLDQAGKYQAQAYVVLADWDGWGETCYFVIHKLFG